MALTSNRCLWQAFTFLSLGSERASPLLCLTHQCTAETYRLVFFGQGLGCVWMRQSWPIFTTSSLLLTSLGGGARCQLFLATAASLAQGSSNLFLNICLIFYSRLLRFFLFFVFVLFLPPGWCGGPRGHRNWRLHSVELCVEQGQEEVGRWVLSPGGNRAAEMDHAGN